MHPAKDALLAEIIHAERLRQAERALPTRAAHPSPPAGRGWRAWGRRPARSAAPSPLSEPAAAGA